MTVILWFYCGPIALTPRRAAETAKTGFKCCPRCGVEVHK